MAKDEQSNQLNLTVVALVALVAIVGLVALVMNAASVKPVKIATGSQLASADENTAGQAGKGGPMYQVPEDPWNFGGGGGSCDFPSCSSCVNVDTCTNCKAVGCCSSC